MVTLIIEGSPRDIEQLPDLQRKIVHHMRHGADRPLSKDQLAGALGLRQEIERLQEALKALTHQGFVVRNRKGRYGLPERMNLVVGELQGHEKGFGFILPDRDGVEDMFVNPEGMNGAMHGDRVVARPTGEAPTQDDWEGEIIRILERVNEEIVGTLKRRKNYAFVISDEKRLNQDVFIPPGRLNGAQDDEKVVVSIDKWPEGGYGPEGHVTERLGGKDDPGVDVLSVIHKYDLPREFPGEVMAEAGDIPATVQPEAIEGRLDLRDLTTITIDGEDAKDFDDAISLERREGTGGWELGVHIADVTHYVDEGSALDREARSRGTSVYLVDRVIPMLPESLSNGICSLRPEVDRLSLSVLMEFDDQGRLQGQRIKRTVIHSDARMTYTDVAAILEDDSSDAAREYAGFVLMLKQSRRLMQQLRQRRSEGGSVDFETPEPSITLDDQGRAVHVGPGERTDAHRMIEEFMLACNRTVADAFDERNIPFLFRIHEEPQGDKVDNLREFLEWLGLSLPSESRVDPRDLQEVLNQVKGTAREYLVSTVILRSMQRARYSMENLGHFGLAADHYTHFTSPIRRYPDLVIHRIIKRWLDHGSLPRDDRNRWQGELPDIAEHASVRERVAEDADRETVAMKTIEYMERHLGETFEGVISGVIAFGLFVQLPNTVEGMVHVSELDNDYYRYDEKSYALVGDRTGERYQLGEAITVEVIKVNKKERKVDLRPVEEE